LESFKYGDVVTEIYVIFLENLSEYFAKDWLVRIESSSRQLEI
jgi:hypothetical protein